jgi:microcin C transport system permease protein
MSPKNFGLLLVLYATLAGSLRWQGLNVPVFKVPFLGGETAGWVLSALFFLVGLWLLMSGSRDWHLSPLTLKQIRRFRSIKQGYWSFLILLLLTGVAMLDNLLVGKRALAVKYKGELFFPFIQGGIIPGSTFGLNYEAETDYRELRKIFHTENQGNWVVLPPIPFASTQDSPDVIEVLEKREDGKYYRKGMKETFSGRAYTSFKDNPKQKRREYTLRYGVLQGEMRGWDAKGEQNERGKYHQGNRTEYTDYQNGAGEALESQASPELQAQIFPPAAPSWHNGHYLGTNSSGGDILAALFGGWQQALLAAVLYVTFVFVAGVIVGGVSGYFGGLTDLLGQRVLEIWAALPFLFVVMIVSALIEPRLIILVGIIAFFGWKGVASYIRTETLREKARDYVSAATLTGASTARVLFKHVLPNTVSVLVTLAPFEVTGIITSLAALDFLGFGLPPDEPSWGRLLQEGTENFNYPWIVASAFAAMVIVLVLVTFVGEAIREAFDPKKFTTYR